MTVSEKIAFEKTIPAGEGDSEMSYLPQNFTIPAKRVRPQRPLWAVWGEKLLDNHTAKWCKCNHICPCNFLFCTP